jgi:putative heme-binding domain-containing protein
VQEHSIIYALIEINSPEAIRSVLKESSLHPFTQRAGLIALDQISRDSLKASEVIPHLTSASPVMKQTARWIVGHRKDWGGELAHYFEGRLRHADLSDSEWNECTAGIASLIESEEIRKMVAQLVGVSQVDERTRKAMLSIMARANMKEAPITWAKSISEQLKSGRKEPELIAAAAGLRFKEVPSDLRKELQIIANDSSLPPATRLQALSVIASSAKLDATTFSFVRSQLAATVSAGDRRLAQSILSRAVLTEEQLSALSSELETASPLDISALLAPYEKGASEKVGELLLAALKKSSALSSLTPDHIQRTFAKFPDAIKGPATDFAASLNADHTQQSARIEQLLPKLGGGDIRRGQAIFNSQTAACSSCHAIGYLGGDIGPDLTRIGQVRTERDLLEAILFPSASFVRSYEPVVVETKEGEQFSGVLRKDAPDEVVLATGPGAEVRIERSNVTETRMGKVSVMPQGLEEQLSEQQLADLIAFLRATRW